MIPMPTKRIVTRAISAALLAGSCVFAGAQAPSPSSAHRVSAGELKAVQERLIAIYPETTITSVTASPIPGLYEIVMGRNVAYSDAQGRYLVFGHMIDGKERVNLTEKRLADSMRVEMSSLPLAKAIKVRQGNGTRQLVVFTDADCPFCRQIEPELEKLQDVTIYYFLMPLTQATPDKAVSIWCAKDRVAAWKLAINGKPIPSARCQAPIDEITALARRFGVQGTPTMVAPDGRVLAGYTAAADIDLFLQQAAPVAAQAK